MQVLDGDRALIEVDSTAGACSRSIEVVEVNNTCLEIDKQLHLRQNRSYVIGC